MVWKVLVHIRVDNWQLPRDYGSYFGGFIHKWTHSGANLGEIYVEKVRNLIK